jgi:hypothetical protein
VRTYAKIYLIEKNSLYTDTRLRFSYSVCNDKEHLEVVPNLENGITDKFRNVAWDSNPSVILVDSLFGVC